MIPNFPTANLFWGALLEHFASACLFSFDFELVTPRPKGCLTRIQGTPFPSNRLLMTLAFDKPRGPGIEDE